MVHRTRLLSASRVARRANTRWRGRLLPVQTTSAHWLAHPAFAQAVDDFLQRERAGIRNYLGELEQHSPFKAAGT